MAVRLWRGKVLAFGADGDGPPIYVCGAPSLTFWPCISATNRQKGGTVTMLACSGSGLTDLDIRGLHALESLNCSNNQLTDLDLSRKPNLRSLKADDNPWRTLPGSRS